MSYATRVPNRRPEFSLEDVKIGLDPRARLWTELGALCNWIRGTGSVLVPAHCPVITKTSGTETLQYRVAPSGRAIARVWIVKLRAGAVPSARATVSADGTSVAVVASAYTTEADGIAVVVGTASKTSSATTISCTVTWTSGTVIIDSLECWELPRAALTKDATDLAVDLGSLEPDRPIIDRDYESVDAIGVALAASDGRRCGLMAWWGPTATFTTAATLFEGGVRIVPPKIGVSDTTRTCTWNAYARVTSGTTTGRVRVVDALGGTSAWVNITSTSFSFLEGTHAFRCEDLSTADGLPGTGWETVNFEFERTAGTGSIEVTGCGVYDGAW